MSGVRLEWGGKSAEVPRLRLPLQVVETVNSPRANRGTIFEDADATAEASPWRNRLIWGDNLHALASLADELAGQVDLIYIDPPFDTRQDYKVRISVGDGTASADQELAKISSVIEEKAYRDTWGRGVESYLQMLYQRLVLLRELLSDRGSNLPPPRPQRQPPCPRVDGRGVWPGQLPCRSRLEENHSSRRS